MSAEPKKAPKMEAQLLQMQIRAVTFTATAGGVQDGFQWRYRLAMPRKPGEKQSRIVTTPWIYADAESVDKMLAEWQRHVEYAKGAAPPSSLQ